MLIVVILVLSLVLTFPTPPLPLVDEREWILTSAALATLLPLLPAWWTRRRALDLLEQHPSDPRRGQSVYGRGLAVTHWAIGATHAALLTFTFWIPMCRLVPWIGTVPMVGAVLGTIPFLASMILTWVTVYPVDRAIRQISLEESLYSGEPVHPAWTLPQYVAFNLRHQVLFIYIPMLFILLVRDLVMHYDERIVAWSGQEHMPDLLLGSAAGLVAVIAPGILRHVWDTQPLPDGPLRDRLLLLCRKLRIRCREILVWRSGGMIVNAAVMGVIAPLRYVMITDAMLERMEDRKIEAVFGHEAGHVKRHHILFFLLFAFISGCWIMITYEYARGVDRVTYHTIMGGLAAVLAVKWGAVFFWVSRQFEGQADLFGVHTLALTGVPRETAAHIFGETLNEVGHLNGIPTEAWSWRHGSLAGRSRQVIHRVLDEEAAARFEQQVRTIKRAIMVLAVISGLWAAWVLRLWTMLGL